MQTELIEVKLIDQLVQKRTQLIDQYMSAIKLQKSCHQLAEQIDTSIPRANAGYYDDFTTIFYDLNQKLGETSAKRHFHRESSILTMPEEKIAEVITQSVDTQLWSVLFNRFGLKAMMSEKQKQTFSSETPLAFTSENVKSTLKYWLQQADNIMLNALIDTVTSLGKDSYVSNHRFKVGTRIIIKDSLSRLDPLTLNNTGELRQILDFVWHLCFGGGLRAKETGLMDNAIWQEIKTQVSESAKDAGGDVTNIESLASHGIQIRFFQNKNAHLLLPDNVVNLLNSKLASENYLTT